MGRGGEPVNVRLFALALFILSLVGCGPHLAALIEARRETQKAFSRDPCLSEALPRCGQGESFETCLARFDKAREARDAACADRETREAQENRQSTR